MPDISKMKIKAPQGEADQKELAKVLRETATLINQRFPEVTATFKPYMIIVENKNEDGKNNDKELTKMFACTSLQIADRVSETVMSAYPDK